MLKKIITYSVAGFVLLFAATIVFSPEYRSDVKVIWYTFVGDKIALMETQVNQGDMALKRYDQVFNTAYNKLTTLVGTQADCKVSARRFREMAETQRRQGREDLAIRSEEQALFFETKLETIANSIEKRKKKLE